MKQVRAAIELINSFDLIRSREGKINPEEVRKIRITVLVDTSYVLMTINEHIQEYLQLPATDQQRSVQLENGELVRCNVVGPVDIRFKNRDTLCYALVLPGDAEPVLGLVPFGGMDVVIDPVKQELVVNPKHPDEAVFRL